MMPADLLLAAAVRLRDDRAANDERFVQAGTLTAEAAADRATCAAAYVTLWQHVVDGTSFDFHDPFAAFNTSWGRLRQDIAAAAASARRRAGSTPGDALFAAMADALETMRDQLGAIPRGDTPALVFAHAFNLRTRERTITRAAA